MSRHATITLPRLKPGAECVLTTLIGTHALQVKTHRARWRC